MFKAVCMHRLIGSCMIVDTACSNGKSQKLPFPNLWNCYEHTFHNNYSCNLIGLSYKLASNHNSHTLDTVNPIHNIKSDLEALGTCSILTMFNRPSKSHGHWHCNQIHIVRVLCVYWFDKGKNYKLDTRQILLTLQCTISWFPDTMQCIPQLDLVVFIFPC